MRLSRWLGRSLRGVAHALFLVPLAILPILACSDTGAEGSLRFSLFPVVLTLHDALVWQGLRNSLMAAALVACGACLIGLGLGLLVSRWRFWGRPVLATLVIGPAAIPPCYLALGLRKGIGSPSELPWISDVVSRATTNATAANWVPWGEWIACAIIPGAALATLATARASEIVEPQDREAARLAGGTRLSIWTLVDWPSIRPQLSRTAAFLFVITVADPGAPLILGLRPTLGTLMAECSIGDDPFPRLAILTLLAAAGASVGRIFLVGHRRDSAPAEVERGSDFPAQPRSTAAWPVAALLSSALLGWILAAWLPVAALVADLPTNLRNLDSPRSTTRDPISLEVGGFAAEHSVPMIAKSLLLGVSMGLTIRIASAVHSNWRGKPARGPRERLPWSSPLLLPAPVVLVAVLGLARSVNLILAWLASCCPFIPVEPAVRWLSQAVDLAWMPSPLLVLGTAFALLPRFQEYALAKSELEGDAGRRADQAMLAGFGHRMVRRLGRRHTARWSLEVLGAALAVTAMTPGLILTPVDPHPVIGPAVIRWAEAPGLLGQAGEILAVGAIALNLSVWAWAFARTQSPRSTGGREHGWPLVPFM